MSTRTRSHHSSTASRSSAHWKAEADRAALAARHKRHAIEEERLHKRKEQFQLDSEYAAQMSKLSVSVEEAHWICEESAHFNPQSTTSR